jgi:hypothetical protein
VTKATVRSRVSSRVENRCRHATASRISHHRRDAGALTSNPACSAELNAVLWTRVFSPREGRLSVDTVGVCTQWQRIILQQFRHTLGGARRACNTRRAASQGVPRMSMVIRERRRERNGGILTAIERGILRRTGEGSVCPISRENNINRTTRVSRRRRERERERGSIGNAFQKLYQSGRETCVSRLR